MKTYPNISNSLETKWHNEPNEPTKKCDPIRQVYPSSIVESDIIKRKRCGASMKCSAQGVHNTRSKWGNNAFFFYHLVLHITNRALLFDTLCVRQLFFNLTRHHTPCNTDIWLLNVLYLIILSMCKWTGDII